MLLGLCGVIVVYALGIVLVHWLARRRLHRDDKHYVLVAGNHEKQIEWYMRSLQWYSRRTGTDIQITVVFENSNDGTEAIVRQFARTDRGIDWSYERQPDRPETQSAERKLVWIELAKQEDLARLPL
ncbi:glycosyltransferase family A protein [Cohnella sp. AR92]|uniref:glycosyltransferase family A protein n=1 Tax=Cohnella sp. AR92 TaxID=648716 RepID=UPI000F8DE83D|nr:glycosyltransferase family A protein [Cohnella sp. AR92]RUS42598.1 hypothetical protein ELR57_26475 [Cohnella sp. AR92]